MATNHTIKVTALADASQMRRELGDSGKSVENVKNKMSDFGKAAVAFVATKALGAVKAFVDDSIRAYSDLEQATGGMEAVFGDQARKIDEWSKAAAQNIGMSESAAKNAAVKIGAFLQNYGFSVEEAADKSIELTNLGADLAAMFGGTVPEAVDAISAALRGEFNPIERYGVSLRVATIEAHALEMGLASTKSEIDDNAKMTAALDLITKQTTKSHGQFARELDTVAGKQAVTAAAVENHKAIVGETIQVYAEWGNTLQLTMGKALAVLALGIQELNGSITEGEATLKRWQVEGGKTITTLDDLGGQIRAVTDEARNISFWGDLFSNAKEEAGNLVDTLPDMIRSLELTQEELAAAAENADVLAASWGLNEEQAAALADALRKELKTAQTEAMEASRRLGAATDEATDATEENTKATNDQVDAIKNQVNWLERARDAKRRDMDATFNLVAAHREAKEAQDEYNAAVEEFGPASDEAIEAGQKVWEKQQALIDAALTFRNEAGPNWEEGFRRQMESAGLSADTIQGVIDKVNSLDGVIKDVNGSTIDIKANVRVPKFRFDQQGNYIMPSSIGEAVFHQGGTFRAATPGGEGLALLRDGEKVYTPEQAQQKELGRGGGTQVVINVGPGLYTQADVGRMIVEALQQYSRTAGPLPADIRIGA